MGTRGTIGVRVNEKDKLSYNHFDSYPDCLGVSILAQVKDIVIQQKLEEYKQKAIDLQLVDDHKKPTAELIEKLNLTPDLSVRQSMDTTKQFGITWYQALRDYQGELLKSLDLGYMIDNANFIKDSLFCEWGYIINFDENVLEVYEGFQKVKANIKGRYKNCRRAKGDDYYACSLVKTYDLDNLPSEAEFLADFKD